jgi:hypothetical protein
MNEHGTDRRGALWGLAFFAFFAAAAAIVIAAGESGNTRQEIVSHYTSHSELQLAGYLAGAAGFCLLPFLGALRTLLRRAEGERDDLSTLAFGAGLVATAMLFMVGAAVAAVATAADWSASDSYRVDPSTAETIEMLGFWFWAAAGSAGGVLAGAASMVALRTRALPKWLAIAGLVVAAVGFAGLFSWGLGFLAVVAWVLLTSLVLLSRSRQTAERALSASVSGKAA